MQKGKKQDFIPHHLRDIPINDECKNSILSRIEQSYKSKSDGFRNIRFSDLEKQLIVKLWQDMNDNDPHCTAVCMICKHHCLPKATVKVYGTWHSKYSDDNDEYQHGVVCNMCLSGFDNNVVFEQPQQCPICGQICIETLAMVNIRINIEIIKKYYKYN